MNVLSLFDGMSCGRIALERAGIPVTNYFASEIDKYAIKVTQANYPDTIQMGDITELKASQLPHIDLIIGGSPCQGFSFAGKQGGLDDPRSALFYQYVRLLGEVMSYNPGVKFLLENVKMKKDSLNLITLVMGVQPIFINNALVSAQNRQRYYWTNIEGGGQPEDRGIVLADIIEDKVDFSFYAKEYLQHGDKTNGQLNQNYKSQANSIHDIDGKAAALCAGTHGYVNGHIKQMFKGAAIQGRYVSGSSGKTEQQMEIRPDDKSNSLTTVQKDSLLLRLQQLNPRVKGISVDSNGVRPHQGDDRKSGVSEMGRLLFEGAEKTYTLTAAHAPKILDGASYRKLTPIECERLQTVPDNYTNHVSNTQRYKMLGNGWTVEAVAHLFKGLRQ